MDTSQNKHSSLGKSNPQEHQNDSLLTAAVPTEMRYPRLTLSNSLRWIIFVLLAIVTYFSVFDGGIIPSKTTEIKRDLKIGNAEYGFFSSVEFVGRLLGALVFTIIINKMNRKYLLIAMLILKGLLLMATYYINNYIILCVFRGFTGISQVFFMIYVPVWCDQYGPRKSRTMMITISQLFLPLGIVSGYGMATFTDNWVWSFIIEGIILLCLAIGIVFIPKLYFSNTFVFLKNSDIEGREILQEATDFEVSFDKSYSKESITKVKKSLWNNLCFMFKEMIFIFTGLSNTVVSFILCVIQFWAPEYMEKSLEITDKNTRFFIFAVICITSPIFGMTFSAILGSYVGGYKNTKAIYLGLTLSAVAAILGVVVSQISSMWISISLLWLFCFCSYAKLPVEVGIIITSLPHHMRGDGYSVINFFVNLIGNLPSSYVYGLLYDYYKDTASSNQAFKIVMYYNFFGLVCLVVSTFFRLKMPADLDASHIYPELQDGNDDIRNRAGISHG